MPVGRQPCDPLSPPPHATVLSTATLHTYAWRRRVVHTTHRQRHTTPHTRATSEEQSLQSNPSRADDSNHQSMASGDGAIRHLTQPLTQAGPLSLPWSTHGPCHHRHHVSLSLSSLKPRQLTLPPPRLRAPHEASSARGIGVKAAQAASTAPACTPRSVISPRYRRQGSSRCLRLVRVRSTAC